MNFLIIGCGLSGIVISRLLTNEGHSCFIIDKRNHIGGNSYSETYNDIDVHVYGPHIFHTSNKNIWDFVNKYDEFIPFNLNIKAKAKDGKLYSLPFNMNTFQEVFNVNTVKDALEKLSNEVKTCYKKDPANLEEQAINMVGPTIYNLLIKEYTEKQWGKLCTELDKNIITRLPVRMSWNNNYYYDIYQGIPKSGYTNWMMNILNGIGNEKPIKYKLNVEFTTDYDTSEYDYVIFTGQLDKLFNYSLGDLEWRSLKFKHKEVNNTISNDQGTCVINYTYKDVPYTRSIDHMYFKYMNNDYKCVKKILTYEYPTKYNRNKDAYYPINNEQNDQLQEAYYDLLKNKYPKFIPLGRLATYQYLDMDDTIDECFKLKNFF